VGSNFCCALTDAAPIAPLSFEAKLEGLVAIAFPYLMLLTTALAVSCGLVRFVPEIVTLTVELLDVVLDEVVDEVVADEVVL
jgi:hypothetical protein